MQNEPPRTPLALPSPTPLPVPPDFGDRLAAIGVALSADVLAKIGDYLARLLAMNEQVNLTSITEPAEAWTRHVLDALSLLPELAALPAAARVLDVGSGGGVPGIPLAIARPDLRFTLLDATAKKVAFLAAVVTALELPNVTTVAGRAEVLGETALGGTFDAVTARAVAKLEALLGWTAPFAKRGGRLLLIKGERAELELGGAKRALRHFRCAHLRTVLTPTGRILVLERG